MIEAILVCELRAKINADPATKDMILPFTFS